MQHILINHKKQYNCTVCGWWWSRKPTRDPCPAKTRLPSFDLYHKTAAQWAKRQRRPIVTITPHTCYLTPAGYSDLWHFDETEPIVFPLPEPPAAPVILSESPVAQQSLL